MVGMNVCSLVLLLMTHSMEMCSFTSLMDYYGSRVKRSDRPGVLLSEMLVV